MDNVIKKIIMKGKKELRVGKSYGNIYIRHKNRERKSKSKGTEREVAKEVSYQLIFMKKILIYLLPVYHFTKTEPYLRMFTDTGT